MKAARADPAGLSTSAEKPDGRELFCVGRRHGCHKPDAMEPRRKNTE